MRIVTAVATTTLVGLALAALPASAKTVKACQQEWQANKAAMQAAGKTEKAYVVECRTQSADAAPAPKVKEDKGGY
jgi:ABC-type proline/glycine betaine transport system substrate-binding protein